MLKHSIGILIAGTLLIASCDGGGSAGNRNIKLNSDKKKLSYAIGQQVGQGLKTQGVDVDVEVIAMSINDVLKDREARMDFKEIRETMEKAQKDMIAKKQKQEVENKEKGAEFLKENKEKDGVTETDSGLQYMVMEKGEGEKPKADSRVKVHYVGTLLDGTEFDSSRKRDKPAEFSLKGVIPGWTEGLQLMKEGAKYKFFVPAELAYGRRGRPGIPPNSVLIFEVELLEILAKGDKKAKADKPEKKES